MNWSHIMYLPVLATLFWPIAIIAKKKHPTRAQLLLIVDMLMVAFATFILTVILRLCGAHRAFSRLREPLSLWAVLPLELTVVWRRLGTAVRYLFASPYDFTTHKQ